MVEDAVVRRTSGGIWVSIERLTGPTETYGPLERLAVTSWDGAQNVQLTLAVGDRVAVARRAGDSDSWLILGRIV